MGFNVFKNTVLLFVLVLISCASKLKNEKGLDVNKNEILKHTSTVLSTKVQDGKGIIVGANQIEDYLPLLQGKRVGVVANQSSVIFKDIGQKTDAGSYTHLVDSLLSLNIDIKFLHQNTVFGVLLMQAKKLKMVLIQKPVCLLFLFIVPIKNRS